MKLNTIKYNDIIRTGNKLESSEIMLLEAFLTICKKKIKKVEKCKYSNIGDELIISNETYTVIDVCKGYYFIASLYENGYHKIKAYPFKISRKSSKKMIDYLFAKTMYVSKTLFNECMPVKKYAINGNGTISWVDNE